MSADDDHQSETYRSMVSMSVEFFKALQYLNGGAMVAILAYITQSKHGTAFAAHATGALVCFAFGLLLGTGCFGMAYLTQFTLFNEALKRPTLFGARHMVWVRVTAGLGVGALVLFVGGLFLALCALRSS